MVVVLIPPCSAVVNELMTHKSVRYHHLSARMVGRSQDATVLFDIGPTLEIYTPLQSSNMKHGFGSVPGKTSSNSNCVFKVLNVNENYRGLGLTRNG